MLFVGPSGIGKSSASIQADLCWSAGREAFGIAPSGALKILQIQAENDDGDLHEMVRGVYEAQNFSEEEERLCRENLLVASEKARTSDTFLTDVVRPLLQEHQPDILRIDPLLAYLGNDPTETKALAAFCRSGLNPLLEEFKCAVILNHHTPKTTNRDTSTWRASDWMYSGAGGADLSNWSRAILVIEPTDNPSAFRFIGAKRGKRLGWRDNEGASEYQRIFCHSENSIAWRESTEEERVNARSKKEKGRATDLQLLAFVPEFGSSIPKNDLLARWGNMGIGLNKCRNKLRLFVADEILTESKGEKRTGTQPAVMVSRCSATNTVDLSK